MTESQTAPRPGRIDFTEMFLTHDAFRRDLDRLAAAATAGQAGRPEVRAGWENFKKQLIIHHTVEDEWLWPRLTGLVADRPDALALLADMEAEHGRLDPLIEAFDEALDARAPDLPARVEELRSTLGDHLEHEEKEALPLIQSVMTPQDWAGFRRAMARRQGIRGAAVWVPWIADGMSPTAQRRFLARMPPPLRVLNKLAWESGYRKRRLWEY